MSLGVVFFNAEVNIWDKSKFFLGNSSIVVNGLDNFVNSALRDMSFYEVIISCSVFVRLQDYFDLVHTKEI